MKRWFAVIAAAALVAVPAASGATDSSKLRDHVRLKAITKHLEALERIADANDGTRASGTTGYQASVDYIVPRLVDKGYQVTVQNFDFPYFEEVAPGQLERVSPTPQTFGAGTDFDVMTYSGSGDTTANVQPVDTTATPATATTSGCQTADFAGFVAGRIALIQRGGCTFRVKALNAQAAGASAAIIFALGSPGSTGLIVGTLGDPGANIPVLGTTFAVGQALYSADSSVVAHVFTSTISEIRQTSNVLADTPGGNPNKVIVAGGHLDSVPEGPGITDNATGTMTLLEIARRLNEVVNIHKTGKNGLKNRVRFAFWGAEEFGLKGSAFYVNNLSAAERSKLSLNLNFDMIASSNGVRFLLDGRTLPGRSPEIFEVWSDYFESQGLAFDLRPPDGRSDWASFTAAGIGAGAVSTGSDHVKSPEQAAIFGGTPGPMHPCYHLACDRLDTVNMQLLDEMSDAAAHAILWFAMDGQTLGKS